MQPTTKGPMTLTSNVEEMRQKMNGETADDILDELAGKYKGTKSKPEKDDMRQAVDDYMSEHKYTSPTSFALDFDIDPAELGERAKNEEWIRYALYRMIGNAEAWLMQKVYGPTAFIKRCEYFLNVSTIGNAAVNDTDDEGLFKSA